MIRIIFGVSTRVPCPQDQVMISQLKMAALPLTFVGLVTNGMKC